MQCDKELEDGTLIGNKRYCWRQALECIAHGDIPDGITNIATKGPSVNDFEVHSGGDAHFAAFRRKYVPYFIPYAEPVEGTSE